MRGVAGKGMGRSFEPGWVVGRQSGYLMEGESRQ